MAVTAIRGGRQITDATIPYADIQNVTANTILGNNTASGTNIQEISLAASNLLGRGSTGNITAITTTNGIEFSGTAIQVTASLRSLNSLTYASTSFVKMTAAGTFALDTATYLTTAVTSVSGTGTVSGLTLTGTVTTTGSLTLGGTLAVTASNFSSQTANTFLAAPNGSAGVPTFRALVAADIPALNYQAVLNGTGFVKATGTTISYDNSTYLTTSAASSTYLPLSGGTLTGSLAASAASVSFQRFSILQSGYIELNPINFRFDQDCLRYINRWGTATITAPDFTSNELDYLFSQYASIVNLQSKTAPVSIEVTGFNIGSSANSKFYPYVFLHSANQLGNIKMEVLKAGAPTVWETAYDGAIPSTGFVIAEYTSGSGNLIGVRWTFSNYTANPHYIRSLGCISRNGAGYAWTVLKGGDTMYGDLNFTSPYTVKIAGNQVLHVGNYNTYAEPVITAGTTSQYWRGDKSWQTLNTAAVAESTNLYYTDARARAAISLTTTGSSGAASYSNITGVFNIPTVTLSGLSGQPLATNLTSLSSLSYVSASFVKMTAAGTFTLDTNTYLTTAVTSVGGTGTVSGLTLSGTVTTSGNLTLGGTLTVTASNFASQTANTFLAAPNGAAGVPTFRAIVAADIPTLNQNTTGQAGSVVQSITFDNTGSGAGTGITYNGSTARTISYNTIGAAPLSHTHTWANITSTPTTLSGYGITDAYTKSETYTKTEVDGFLQGLDPKASVKAATTGNITLSNVQTIDGVSVVAGDRVLVKDQSTPSQNGIYNVVNAGSWTRATDMDSATEFAGAYVFVEQGTANADKGFVCTNDSVTVGVTNITFVQFSGSGAYQSVLNGTGYVKMSGTSLSYISSIPNADLANSSITIQGTSVSLGGSINVINGTGFVKASGTTISYDNSTYYLASNPSGYTTNTGTVTSIATTGPITGGTITTSGTIGITQAGSASNGYLSSTDWNTFNNKQNALTDPVTGTGTLNYIPKFTATGSAIGDSIIQDDGTQIGIGAAPTQKLDVNGTLRVRTINYVALAQPKFLVANTNGVIYYRDPADILSDIGGASAADSVTITTTQTISGEKTFSSVIKGDLGFDTLNAQAITWRDTGYAGGLAKISFTNSSGMALYSDGVVTPTMFLTDDGNRRVGIGLTNPAYKLEVNGTLGVTGAATFTSSVTASSFVKTSGTSSQFLKADGSIDSNTYITGNQSITLSGDVSGSGTTSITTTLATVTVAKGGTGATTLTGVVIGNGTSAMTAVSGTASQLLRRNAGNTAYEFFTPTYLTSYTETDTLATVTGRGASTSTAVTFSGGVTLSNTLSIANATSPNTHVLQFGDNTGWAFRFMTSVSGTPTTRFTFTDAGNFTSVGSVTGSSLIKSGGTSSQFLKADGSVDSSTYTPTSGTGASGTWGINITGSAGSATTAGSVTNSITFATSGGSAAGTTYDGSVARTLSWNTIGALPQARVVSNVNPTSITPDPGSGDLYVITNLQNALTINAPGGSPYHGQKLMIRITAAGVYALTWNAAFRASSDLTLPSTTVSGKTAYYGFIYNLNATKWDLLAKLDNFA